MGGGWISPRAMDCHHDTTLQGESRETGPPFLSLALCYKLSPSGSLERIKRCREGRGGVWI